MVFEIEIDRGALDALAGAADKVKDYIIAGLDDFMRSIESDAKFNAPIRTGNLRASHVIYAPDEFTRVLTVDTNQAPYAVFVHEGTSPHVIEPVRARSLFFDGRFAKRVHHPGTPPNPWMRDVIEDADPTSHIENYLSLLLGGL